jgi:hypothetical protein
LVNSFEAASAADIEGKKVKEYGAPKGSHGGRLQVVNHNEVVAVLMEKYLEGSLH